MVHLTQSRPIFPVIAIGPPGRVTVMASQQEVSSSSADQTARKRVSVPSMTRDYSYYRAVFAGRRMPFAFVDLDLFEANIRQVVEQTAGKRVRVASKSVRSV